MKILFRIAKWLFIAAGCLGLLIPVCWFLLPDQSIDAEAARLLAKPAAPPPDQNGYFQIWGMMASPELDPHEAGRKIVAEHERFLTKDQLASGFKPEQYLGATPLSVTPARKRCPFETEKCLAYFQVTQADYLKDMATHRLQLERYRFLRGYPRFSETVMTMSPTSPFPAYAPVLGLSDLVDADIALKIANPKSRKEALEELAAEIELWRRIARDSDSLINQAVAVAALQRKYHLASEILSTYPEVIREHSGKVKEISAPIPLKELSMARPLQGEFRFAAQLYRNLERATRLESAQGDTNDKIQAGLLRMGAFKPNASINHAYTRFRDAIELFGKAPPEMVAGRAALARRHASVNPWRPDVILYNPIGRQLDGEAAVDMSEYAFRLVDLVGLSRMVELQRRSIEGTRPTGAVPHYPDEDRMTNPYTGQSFDWDLGQNTMSFIGHGGKYLKEGRVVLELGR